MKQRILAMMTGFERYTKKTRRTVFLEEMEQLVPWRELCALIETQAGQPAPAGGSGTHAAHLLFAAVVQLDGVQVSALAPALFCAGPETATSYSAPSDPWE